MYICERVEATPIISFQGLNEVYSPVNYRVSIQPGRRRCLTLDGIHGGASSELLILVAELGDLEKGVDAVALEAVQLEAAGPVLGVDAAEGQADAEAEVGGSHGEGGEGAVVVVGGARGPVGGTCVLAVGGTGEEILQLGEVAVDAEFL